MAEFDQLSDDVWAEVKTTYGNRAIWRPTNGLPVEIVVVDREDNVLTGGGFDKATPLYSAEIDPRDISRPQEGDLIEIIEGRMQGQYRYEGILEEDTTTFLVSLGKVV